MQLHRRQFVIGPSPVRPASDWVTTHIPDTGYLSHSPELRVASATDADGRIWHVLGLVVQTDANKSDPVREVAGATHSTIEHVYQTWAGRWILIGNGELHMDAAGLLSCFYSLKETGDGTRELWVSGSVALLADLLRIDISNDRQIRHGEVAIDWYPPPRSRYEAVRRLLPSQVLVLANGDLRPRRLFPEITTSLGYDDVLDTLQRYLTSALQEASKAADTLWLPLTAGYDSRLLLAAAHYAGVSVKTYTQGYKNIEPLDRDIPPKLAEAVGMSHSLYWDGAYNSAAADLWDRHTGHHCVAADRRFVSHGQFEWCKKGDIILRGGGFEVGRCSYRRRFPESRTGHLAPSAEVIVRGLGRKGLQGRESLVRAMQEWVDWTMRTPHEELSWWDRLYLEQRIGGWASLTEQSLDLLDGETYQASNSQFFYAHVLQIPAEKRCATQHHVDLIGRMAPELLAFPFTQGNVRRAIHLRVLRRLKKEMRRYLGQTRAN